MVELVICDGCGCHVRAGDDCPFCVRRTKKLVLAMIAGAVTLGSFGCAYGMPDERCETGMCADSATTDSATSDTAVSDTGRADTGATDASTGD